MRARAREGEGEGLTLLDELAHAVEVAFAACCEPDVVCHGMESS